MLGFQGGFLAFDVFSLVRFMFFLGSVGSNFRTFIGEIVIG